MDSKEAIDNVKKIVKVAYDDTGTPDSTFPKMWDGTGTPGDNQIWTSTGTDAYVPYVTSASIEKIEFKEPSLQRIYDKIIKLTELVEETGEEFSKDLEYILRARDVFVRNNGYINRESFRKLNKLWKKYNGKK
ncbi:hypothetical protein H8D04_00485 [bacterium]|nr:hypothetical protein [bacterium]